MKIEEEKLLDFQWTYRFMFQSSVFVLQYKIAESPPPSDEEEDESSDEEDEDGFGPKKKEELDPAARMEWP